MDRKHLIKIIQSIAGFAVALIINIVVPVRDAASEQLYPALGLYITAADLYRAVLLAIMAVTVIKGVAAIRKPDALKAYQKRSALRLGVGIALALWDIAGTKLELLPQPFFPGPSGIAEAFLEDGEYILQNTMYSMRLFFVGFILGVIIGIITGVLIGCFPKVAYWVEPVLNICGVIPPVAWMPFALILFATAFQAAVFLLVICVWFPVTSMTALGVTTTPKLQMEAAHMLGAGKWYRIFTVAIPHAMPQVFTGITTAEAFAFTNLVMAEMMGQPGGLGYYINASKVWSAYYKVFAAILVMAVLFSLIKWVIDRLQNYVLRWQKGVIK
mgnify:CR=1 FL=1